MEIQCPACSQRLRVPDTAVGKSARCRTCGHVFPISAELDQDAVTDDELPDWEDQDDSTRGQFESARSSSDRSGDREEYREPTLSNSVPESRSELQKPKPASRSGGSYGWVFLVGMFLLFKVGPKVMKLFMAPQPVAPVVREEPIRFDFGEEEVRKQRERERIRMIEEIERRQKNASP